MRSSLHRRTLLQAALAAPLASIAGAALAQPAGRTITIVVPFPPGGSQDVIARAVAAQMQLSLKQSVVVDNKPGAGGNIGAMAVARAAPDGQTVLAAGASIAITPHLQKASGFDPAKELAGTSLITAGPFLLVANPNAPYQTLEQFLAYARANPGKVNYGSTGPATTGHLVSEEFARITGTRLFHIPYAGVAPANTALLSGDIHMLWNDVLLSMPGVRAGKVKMLAVATARRSPVVPDIPTVGESGYPGFEPAFKFGYFAPAGTPRPIIDKLNAEVLAALEAPAIKAAAAERGWQLAGTSPEGYARMLTDEIAFWGRIVRDAGIEKQ